MDCIFCQIVAGRAPHHPIWQDDEYLAFLSIFPNTEGATIVIPKRHYPSYAFALTDKVLAGLTIASKRVGLILDSAFPDVGRTAIVYEGFGVDHVHAKLFPLHGTRQDVWQPITSSMKTYFKTYEGYVSSHSAARADDSDLAKLAARIRVLSR